MFYYFQFDYLPKFIYLYIYVDLHEMKIYIFMLNYVYSFVCLIKLKSDLFFLMCRCV